MILAVIFVLVSGLVVYAIVRYRERPGSSMPRQLAGSRKLEFLWTAVPIGLLATVFVFTAKTMRAANPKKGTRPADLLVVGHQWWWEVKYLKSGVITANEIHLPVGKAVLIQLEAADVIHDFWVPQLGRKIDAIPGHTNYLWLRADRPGVYSGICAEFCGTEHAWMRFEVVVQSPEEFTAWEQAQLKIPQPPSEPEALAGMKLFNELTCVNCHRLAGTRANQTAGPDLTHLAQRRMLAGGAAVNNPQTLAEWLKDPDRIKPGSNMPNFHLSDAQVRALVAYLETTK